MVLPGFPLSALRRSCQIRYRLKRGGRLTVLDLIFIVLGFGGILAMAGYAVLCDRI